MEYCDTCKQGTEYNGWTNRETWACKLWLDNSPDTHNEARTQLHAHDLEEYTIQLLDATPEEFKDIQSMRNDIGSVWRVNFYEIWQSYEDDRKELSTCPDCFCINGIHTRASCNE